MLFFNQSFLKCVYLKPGKVNKGLWDVEDDDNDDDDDDEDDENDDGDGEDWGEDEGVEEKDVDVLKKDVVVYPAVVVVKLDVVAVVFREDIPDAVDDVYNDDVFVVIVDVVVVVVVVLSWKRNESVVELSWLTNCINRT